MLTLLVYFAIVTVILGVGCVMLVAMLHGWFTIEAKIERRMKYLTGVRMNFFKHGVDF